MSGLTAEVDGGAGVNLINVLHAAFTHVAPQIVRTQSSRQYLFIRFWDLRAYVER